MPCSTILCLWCPVHSSSSSTCKIGCSSHKVLTSLLRLFIHVVSFILIHVLFSHVWIITIIFLRSTILLSEFFHNLVSNADISICLKSCLKVFSVFTQKIILILIILLLFTCFTTKFFLGHGTKCLSKII